MKGVINKIAIVLMCLMFVLTSCIDTIVPDYPPNDGEKIPIAIDLQGLITPEALTRSLVYPGDSVAGSTLENSITDVTAYIFDAYYQCEEILQEVIPPISAPVGPVLVTVGTKHIVVVLNGVGKMPLSTTPSAVSYNALLEQLTNDSGLLPESAFLMTGLKNNVVLPSQVPISAPHIIPVEVKRACSKVKFSIGKSGKALGRTLTLTDITMYQGARRVPLMRAPSSNPTLYNITKSLTIAPGFLVPDLTPAGGGFIGYAEVLDSIYTYESLCGQDTTKAIRMEVQWEMSGVTRMANFFLALDKSFGDSIYNVRRNTWYDVKMNIVDPGSDSIYVDIIACPWNVTDTIKRIEGAGAEVRTALPFKLVKNYTFNEMETLRPISPVTSYGAIQSHSKGASWIDLKVTLGAQWQIDVKDYTSRNQDVYYSLDSVNWESFSVLPITGLGNDDWQRIYIYRPYRENNEPKTGPSLYLSLFDEKSSTWIHKQDFIIQPRDTVPIPTNSYVLRPRLTGAPVNETRAYIPLAGVFSHWEDYIYDNGVAIPNQIITADVLWQDDSIREVVRDVMVIHDDKRDSAYIYVEAGAPGNAEIAMRLQGSTEIYWSFHIWVTEYNPYEAAGQKFYETSNVGGVKNVFMDRNLGAMSNSNDPEGNARGLLYQFGRKDPFPRGKNWDNAPPWAWYVYGTPPPNLPLPFNPRTAASTAPASDLRPKNALKLAINFPDEFITGSGGINWPLWVENENLWSSKEGFKTAYDPCPEGWRIPEVQGTVYSSTNFPWYGNLLNSAHVNGFVSSTNGWYSLLVGYYPNSGYINTSGAFSNISTQARYWTSFSFDNVNAIGLVFGGSYPVIGNTMIEKFWGASVRCVVDKNYINKAENGGLFGTGIINLKDVLGLP